MEKAKSFTPAQKQKISNLATKLATEVLDFAHLVSIDFGVCPNCDKPNCAIQFESNEKTKCNGLLEE